jgi:hypothetical protein
MPGEQVRPLAVTVLDDGRIAVVSDSGVAVSEMALPEPDPRLLDDIPRGTITIHANWDK